MMTKEFRLDSQYVLRYNEGRYFLNYNGKDLWSGYRALGETQEWIDRFGERYPRYKDRLQKEFDEFTKE